VNVETTHGYVAPGFEPVRDEFRRNFAEREELGAAFAVHRAGQPIVDLWGGVADRDSRAPWRSDTLQTIFSGTKGLVAICVLLLLDRGLLQLDDAVADHWPEWASGGKQWIQVRDLVSHRARLPGVEKRVSVDELTDQRHMARILEQQASSEDLRAELCYHALTFGWLCGELVRRIDGRSVGRFFNEEIAGPLELDLWIGLPAELESRVATLELSPDWPVSKPLTHEAHQHDRLLRSIWGNPPVFSREVFPWNSGAYRRAEIPGAGAIGAARSVARLYSLLPELVSAETLHLARTTLSEGLDSAHEARRRFGIGFELQTELMTFGPEPAAFGHGGAGGSIHGSWPDQRIGFSYAMNRLRDDQPVDPRAHALLQTLNDALSAAAGE
jgi:CubicO group peptidase (beta-lactamase class C family)